VTDGRYRLATVFAHPDDDAYQVGGWIAMHADRTDLTMVFCTSGDAGPIWVEGSATRETLGSVREREQRAFLETVGAPHADVHFLRYPDYHLNDVDPAELAARVRDILEPAAPDVVVTFGPEGATNHHDHIAAGAAGDGAFHAARDAGGSGFLRLLHVAIPDSTIDRFYAAMAERGDTGFGGRDVLFNPTGVPDHEIAIRVDTRGVLGTKMAGVLAHRTQIGELERIPADLRWLYFEEECFTQAWPPRRPGDPVRSNLFEGLPPAGG
jgi:N-acetyl-1-D-myo-inositol-2-amino-2-deoxy-alpha-D-glucopyranoside deacetylase